MGSNNIPDWKLEFFLLGELSPQEMKSIKSQIENDQELNARFDKLKESNVDILSTYSVNDTVKGINEKLNKSQKKKKSEGRKLNFNFSLNLNNRFVPVFAVLSFALVTFFLFKINLSKIESQLHQTASLDTTRIKGLLPKLKVYRKNSSEPELLMAKTRVKEGDVLQIKYLSAKYKFGCIFSIDGRGISTLHFPKEGPISGALKNKITSLEFAYELDDAPHYEIFYFVVNNNTFEIQPIINMAIQKSKSYLDKIQLDVDKEFRTDILKLQKDTP